MDLSLIDCFVKVADAGSISAASRLHRLPKSTLSYRLRQLEDKFGIELFVREGHRLHLTDGGSELLRHARRIQASCDEAAMAMVEMHQEVAGILRIGSTGEFGTTTTSELLYAFQKAYPQVILDLVFLTARQSFGDVSEMPLDGVFYWGEPSDSGYISRCLTTASYRLYASPDYLARNPPPMRIEDLLKHRGLFFRNTIRVQPWNFLQPDRSEREILLPAVLFANDYWTLKYFAVAGQGIAFLPDFFVETESKNNLLHPVLPDCRSRESAINLIYSRRRHLSRRFKAFVSFCLEFYRKRERNRTPRYFVESFSSLEGPDHC